MEKGNWLKQEEWEAKKKKQYEMKADGTEKL